MIIIDKNEIELQIHAGRAQIKYYWIASIKDIKSKTRYSIDTFLKSSEFDDDGFYVRLFKNIPDGEYIISTGKKSKRQRLKVDKGIAKLI